MGSYENSQGKRVHFSYKLGDNLSERPYRTLCRSDLKCWPKEPYVKSAFLSEDLKGRLEKLNRNHELLINTLKRLLFE